MDPVTMMAVMGAAGMGMGALQAQEARKKERQDALMASEIAKWSPWTKMQPNQIDRAGSNLQYMGQGGLSGAAFGQNLAQADAYSKYLDKTAAAPAATPSAPAPTPAALTAPGQAMTDLPATGPVNARVPAQPVIDEFGQPLDTRLMPQGTWLRMRGGQ